MSPRIPHTLTLAVFAAVAIIGGLNPVAVRYSNLELAPLWGAGLRFALASVLLFAIVSARRAALPRGRALIGVVLYGALGFATSYALAYYGLVTAPPAAAAVTISLVPLITLILAPLHGLERFRAQAMAGAVLSVIGVAVVLADQLSASVPPLALAALLLGAVAVSESTIVVKRFPRSDPAVTNALAMAVGAAILLVLSVAIGEPHILPAQTQTIFAMGYLVVIGSVLLFMGFLYVLSRWTASAASYQLLFMPLVAAPAGALLLGQRISGAFAAGAALALAGVYFGAIAPPIRLPWQRQAEAPSPPGSAAIPAIASSDGTQVPLVPPNCP